MSEPFVRVPTAFLETLMQRPLSGIQLRILIWVIRQTYGWNRGRTHFSWYRIANQLSADRGGVVRAGNRLRQMRLIAVENSVIAVADGQGEFRSLFSNRAERRLADQLSLTDRSQRRPVTADIASDDASHRYRCQETSLFIRAKDSSKERLKTYIDRHEPKNISKGDAFRKGAFDKSHLAGAARPVPGKYGRLS